MRKRLFLFLLCLWSFKGIAQNYTIEVVNMEESTSALAKEIIKENTPNDERQYAYKIIQNGDIFIININATPGNISATEQTIDLRNKMETTILKAINKVKKPTVSAQPQQTATAKPVSQETAQQNQPTTNAVSAQPKPQPTQQPQAAPQNNVTVTPVQPVQQNYPQQQPQTYQSQPQQPVYQQPTYSNPQMNPYGGNMGYMQSYTEADVRKGIAKVGGKICFGDGSCGVIYFLDGMGHGLAVSLDQTTAKWQNANKTRNCQDIYMLPNEKNISTYCNIGLGAQQTQMIINQLGWGQAPAAEWCTRHGNGWYLPSAGELWNLIAIANYNMNPDSGKKRDNNSGGEDGFISRMLQAAGGQPITNDWYWCSSEAEEGQEEAYNISASGRTSSEEKTYELQVRAVRSF